MLSIETDNRVQEVLTYNNVKSDASILNINRDPNRTTDKYVQTDDIHVVQTLNSHGWYITSYKEVNPHKNERQGFQKYLAVYENPDFPGISQGKAQLLQRGSHDGSTKLVLDAGFFTFVCANGLIVGDRLFEPISVKHIGNLALELNHAVDKFVNICPKMFEQVQSMAVREMKDFEANEFARRALTLRFPEDPNKLDPKVLLVAQHREQQEDTLWNVLNRVQENIIRPSKDIKIVTPSNKERKLRGINNIDVTVKLNKDLWELASQYVQ
jgi:hypothetical protein